METVEALENEGYFQRKWKQEHRHTLFSNFLDKATKLWELRK